LKQHPAAIDQIGEVFYLSEGEKQLLLSADKGQGIFLLVKTMSLYKLFLLKMNIN